MTPRKLLGVVPVGVPPFVGLRIVLALIGTPFEFRRMTIRRIGCLLTCRLSICSSLRIELRPALTVGWYSPTSVTLIRISPRAVH